MTPTLRDALAVADRLILAAQAAGIEVAYFVVNPGSIQVYPKDAARTPALATVLGMSPDTRCPSSTPCMTIVGFDGMVQGVRISTLYLIPTDDQDVTA